jgi:hypothetical protein
MIRRAAQQEGYRLGLGGHEAEIEDIPARVGQIIEFHERRLARTMEICREPKTVSQIAREMFPNARDYHVLLALTETGAHIEYLHERGKLVVTNLEEIERERNPVPLYHAVE